MRWHVEVMSMDKTDAQSVVVEAESWQRALQAARTARGEKGPISGFSIELLDEGYRAVDPLARLRFDVKRAAEDTPLTYDVVGADAAFGYSMIVSIAAFAPCLSSKRTRIVSPSAGNLAR